LEFGLAQKPLGMRTGSRTGVIIHAFLHQEGRPLIDEIGKLGNIADRRLAAEKVEQTHSNPILGYAEFMTRSRKPRGWSSHLRDDNEPKHQFAQWEKS